MGDEIREKVETAAREERAGRAAEAAEKAAKQSARPSPSSQDVLDALWDNQVGDARLLCHLGEGRYCYDNTTHDWYHWEGNHWKKDGDREAELLVDKVADIYKAEAGKQDASAKTMEEGSSERKRARANAEALRKRAFALRSDSRICSVLRRATAGRDSLGISGEEWDLRPTLLPCANGVVDLETGKLYPGEPTQYLRRASPVEYANLNANAPIWDDVISKAMRRKEEVMRYFGLVLGYASTGLSTHKEFFAAFGPGGDNAKSVIFETLAKILGPMCGTINVATLLDDGYVRTGAGPSPDILKLRGLRLAVTSEAEQKHRFSMQKMKSLVSGGDRIMARGLYEKQDVEFIPSHTLILHTNFMPKAAGNDKAFFNRLRVIPFRARFVGKDREDEVNEDEHIYLAMDRTKLERKLAEEAPGILAYLVRNAKDFLKNLDLTAPKDVLEETRSYKDDQDLAGRFLDACCVLDPETRTQMADIYRSFVAYCVQVEGFDAPDKKGSKNTPNSMIWLSREFKVRPEIKKLQERPVAYYGIRIKNDWVQPLPVDGKSQSQGSLESTDEVPF